MSDFEVLRRLAAVTAMSEEEVEQARAARDFTDGSIWQLEGVTPRHSVPDLNDEQVRALTSDEALLKVIEFEVTSEAVYRKKYEKPIAPAGQSGITIGIGYDLGHNDQAGVRRDLAEQVLHDDIEVLIKACGIKGDAARQRLAEFRNVRVTWEAAREIYRRATVPRFARDVLRTFPNAVELKGHCFGALLSWCTIVAVLLRATDGARCARSAISWPNEIGHLFRHNSAQWLISGKGKRASPGW